MIPGKIFAITAERGGVILRNGDLQDPLPFALSACHPRDWQPAAGDEVLFAVAGAGHGHFEPGEIFQVWPATGTVEAVPATEADYAFVLSIADGRARLMRSRRPGRTYDVDLAQCCALRWRPLAGEYCRVAFRGDAVTRVRGLHRAAVLRGEVVLVGSKNGVVEPDYGCGAVRYGFHFRDFADPAFTGEIKVGDRLAFCLRRNLAAGRIHATDIKLMPPVPA
jgi:hypothetical protein